MRNKDTGNKAYTSKPKGNTPSKEGSQNVLEPKGKERREENPRSVDQGQTSLSLEDEISNINISVPLTELLKTSEYHSKISIVLKPPGEISAISDSLNLQDEIPTILSVPHVYDPFYEYFPLSMLV